jgi:hypothetical protein
MEVDCGAGIDSRALKFANTVQTTSANAATLLILLNELLYCSPLPFALLYSLIPLHVTAFHVNLDVV